MSNDGDEPITFEKCEVARTTDKALLCWIDGDKVWIPKSQIDDDSELYDGAVEGDTGTLVIPRWLAIDKALVDEEGAEEPWDGVWA